MKLLLGLAWDVVVIVWHGITSPRESERSAWLVPRAQYEADCRAYERELELVA